jgi:N-carbamoylputrescine amidase
MKRREFLKNALRAAAVMLLPVLPLRASPRPLRIALLHLAPVPGNLTANRRLLARAVETAAAGRADWILTPELCTCGYAFSEVIGTDWIGPQPDEWMQSFCGLTARLGVTVFLSHPEQDPRTRKRHNTVFVIGPDGSILGRHRKIRTLATGAEAWSSPGQNPAPIAVPPIGRVGVLVCADAYPDWIAKKLKDKGARMLVSAAAWAPGLYGPEGEWERCSRDTGLPLLVCNRTGVDLTLDFSRAESVVVKDGRRLHSWSSASPALFLFDWDPDRQAPTSRAPRTIRLSFDDRLPESAFGGGRRRPPHKSSNIQQ